MFLPTSPRPPSGTMRQRPTRRRLPRAVRTARGRSGSARTPCRPGQPHGPRGGRASPADGRAGRDGVRADPLLPRAVRTARGSLRLVGLCRIVPLGGLGEVGKNMTVYEAEDSIVVVDAGLAFPRDEHLGVDLVLPDFSYLREREQMIRAVVLTHGHEDHV